MARWTVLLALLALAPRPHPGGTGPVIVGAGSSGDSCVLAEVAGRALAAAGTPADRRSLTGGERALWQALKSGRIDVYPERSDTVSGEILKGLLVKGPADMRRYLLSVGVGMTGSLGFVQTRVLVVRRALATRLALRRLSDLRRHPGLRAGITTGSPGGPEGWARLANRHGLPDMIVRRADEDSVHAWLQEGVIDLGDMASTDARLALDDLTPLVDDMDLFPRGEAVFLYRKDLDLRSVEALTALEGTIDAATMIRMNAEAARTGDCARGAALLAIGRPRRENGPSRPGE